MRTTHRPLRSLLVLLFLMLGLAMAAPAGIAAQDDDESTAPAEIDAPAEDATGTDDGDQGDEDAPEEFIMPDEVDTSSTDDAPPDCDDEGWRIVTTEDNAGFESEDHCDDHVERYGAASLVTLGAEEDDEYIALTLIDQGSRCSVRLTLVNGRPDQVVSVTVDISSGQRLLAQFIPGTGDVSDVGVINFSDQLTGGSAMILTLDFEPTGREIPIYPNDWRC